MQSRTISVFLLSGLLCGKAFAQAKEEITEPIAIVELGGAISSTQRAKQPSFGPTFAIEFTPIEKWLELEMGVTPTFRRHSTEWGTDLLFKKPWTLSKKVEFMFGVGPEWVHSREYGITSNSISGEAVLDFMFWPSKGRRFGWYFEPGYEYSLARGHEKSINITGGLLISIRSFHSFP